MTSILEIMSTSFCVKECPGADSKPVECNADHGKYCGGAGKTSTAVGWTTKPTRTIIKYCLPKGDLGSTVEKLYEDMMR